MSRITKEIAKEVALKLTDKKLKEIQKLNEDLKEKLEIFILERVPIQVMAVFKNYPHYVEKTNYFRISGQGFNFMYLNTKNTIPYNGNYCFEPNEKEAKELLKIINKKDDLKSKYESLIFEIENLLYNLRTYSKVILEFPEAEEFLPKQITNKLMININDVRRKLK